MKSRSLIRIGSAFGLAGAALGTVVNLVHPRSTDLTALSQLDVAASSSIWNIVHYGILLAVFLFVGGYFALERFSEDTPGAAWARLGLFFAVGGAAVGAIYVAIDGYALKTLADHWDAAGRPTEGPVFEAVNVARVVGLGLFNVFTGTMVGFAPILGGVATIKSGRFPGWLGAFGIVGGVIGVAVDIYQATVEITEFSADIAFTAAALIVTFWGVVLNQTMFKAAGQAAEVVEPSAARV